MCLSSKALQDSGGFQYINTDLRQVPYTNAGLGVWTIVNEEELAAFMRTPHHYESFIVQVSVHIPSSVSGPLTPSTPSSAILAALLFMVLHRGLTRWLSVLRMGCFACVFA
jgi:hypothetical protein